MFDFSLLNKPIFIYTTDYEKYVSERGVYFNLKETNLSMFEDDQTLLKYIQNYDEEKEIRKSYKFSQKFIEVRKPIASQKIINEMKEGIS